VDVALCVMALVWAANMVLLKALLGALSPPALSAIRFSFVVIVAWAVALARGGPLALKRPDVPRVALAAFSGIALYQVLFMEGLSRTTAFASNLLQGMEPLFGLVLVWATGGVVLARQFRGVGVAMAGAVLFFLQDASGGTLFTFGSGDLLNLTSAFCFAVYSLLSGELFRRYPGHVVMAWSMTLGTLPLVLWAAPALARTSWASLSPAAWGALAFSAIGPVFVGYWIWNWAVARRGLAHASLYLFLDIVLTGVLAYLFLGEAMGPLRMTGAGLILAGLHLGRTGEPPHPE
jgi:drug/metabolite transporter (DMT)-like permease